jgi:Ca2+-binding EF-hand superfamily protein
LKSIFTACDRDQSGKIDRRELRYLIQRLYEPSDAELEEMMKRFDLDADRGVTEEEYVRALTTPRGPDGKLITAEEQKKLALLPDPKVVEEIRADFKRKDKDASGKLEIKELYDLVRDHYLPPNHVVDRFLNLFDQNKDGGVSFEEVQKALEKVRVEMFFAPETKEEEAAAEARAKAYREAQENKKEGPKGLTDFKKSVPPKTLYTPADYKKFKAATEKYFEAVAKDPRARDNDKFSGHYLVITGIKATSKLASKDLGGKSDPYAVVWLENSKYGAGLRTEYQAANLEPVWDFSKAEEKKLVFPLSVLQHKLLGFRALQLNIDLWDKDYTYDDAMGFTNSKVGTDSSKALDMKVVDKDKEAGSLAVTYTILSPAPMPAAAEKKEEKVPPAVAAAAAGAEVKKA